MAGELYEDVRFLGYQNKGAQLEVDRMVESVTLGYTGQAGPTQPDAVFS